MFVMTIEAFDPGYSKFSARGPLIKDVFQGIESPPGLFLSFGISGNTAMGGKIATVTLPSFQKAFIDHIKEELSTRSLQIPVLDPYLAGKLADLVDDQDVHVTTKSRIPERFPARRGIRQKGFNFA